MNNLLSEEYCRVLEQEHASRPWGTTGWNQAPHVYNLIQEHSIKTMLDYGCGRGSLGHWFDKNVPQGVVQRTEYEPGIPKLSALPDSAELVVCVDVMEHVEPSCVLNVLDHIQSLAQRWVYFNISLRPAARTLCDGRNAHLTLKDEHWWRTRLTQRWDEQTFWINHTTKNIYWTGSFRA
jgi:hypothetical protein